MIIPFDKIADSSKIWIYQSSRAFKKQEQDQIESAAKEFIGQWAAHGKDLSAAFAIKHDQFLIMAVDEGANLATGCSIDSSVGFMRSIGSEFNVDLFDRSKIAFILNDNIQIESLNNFKNKVKSGEISDSAIVFNNAVTVKSELREKWMLPLGESWAGRFLPSPMV